MAGAQLILREKTTDEQGNLRELVIWRIKPSREQPEGVRYRLAFLRRRQKTPAVLYDNHRPKGHHRHIEGMEEQYHFVDVDRLLADFIADIRRLSGAPQ